MTPGELALVITKHLLQSGADGVEAVAALRITLRQGEAALRTSDYPWAMAEVDRLEREFWQAQESEEAPTETPS